MDPVPKAIAYVPYEGPIVTRAEAKAAGAPRYFTGRPCPHGHIAERTTANGTCRVCSNWMSHASKRADPEKYNTLSRDWQRKHKVRLAAKAKALRQRDPERVKARKDRYSASEKGKARRRDHYIANAETIKKRVRDWVEEFPEKRQVISRNYRSREAAAEGSHTAAEIRDLLDKQLRRCVYCSASIVKKFHADHIVPLVKGGSNWISNIQLTCPTCNHRKNRIDPIAFANRLGRLL